MKYLSPEIEKYSKQSNTKSLVRPGVSCGIFQDCNANEAVSANKQPQKASPKDK